MAIDDVYVVTISANEPQGVLQNSMAFVRTTATEPITADFVTLGSAMKEISRTVQNSAIAYSTVKARQFRGGTVTWPSGPDCTPTGGAIFEGSLTGTLTGGATGQEMLPPQCALVTTLRTAQVGRRRRGRWYTGGLSELNQNGGTWVSSILTTLDGAWLSFFNTYTPSVPASGFRLGIWSVRTASGCVPGPNGKGHVRVDAPNPAAAFEPCTTYVLRNTVYTQRRRVLGVGR